MITEQDNFAVVQTELDTIFNQYLAYDATTPNIATARTEQVFKQIPSWDRAAYIGEVNASVGLFDAIGETQVVPEDTPKVRNKYVIYIQEFAKGISLSKQWFDDNMHQTWSNDVREMARKALMTQDFYAMGLWRNSFTTQLTADSVSFINAAHPLIKGGTVSNLITGALSNATFNNAMVALREQKDQTNTVVGDSPSGILVPSKLFQLATQVTESALISDSANNAINVWRSAYNVMVHSSPYLGANNPGGSDTAWWMFTPRHSVTRIVRQGVETALTPWQYSKNLTYWYQANFREQIFVPDYAGVVGSTGV